MRKGRSGGRFLAEVNGQALLDQHFTTTPEPRRRAIASPPNRRIGSCCSSITRYTQRGLTWEHLKGVDAASTTVLAEATRPTGVGVAGVLL